MLYKKKYKIESIPERDIPKFTSKKMMFVYQAFADACTFYDITGLEYLNIKKIKAEEKNGIWNFKYKYKKGLFAEYNEIKDYDENWEEKIKEEELKRKEAKKEQERKRKEDERRIKRISRGR
jgi:hypothetical protein